MTTTPIPTATTPVAVAAPSASARLAALAARWWMLAVLVAVLAAATALYPRFWAPGNLINLLAQNVPLGIMAVGMTYAMIAGGFDLSVGAIYATGAVTAAGLGQTFPLCKSSQRPLCARSKRRTFGSGRDYWCISRGRLCC